MKQRERRAIAIRAERRRIDDKKTETEKQRRAERLAYVVRYERKGCTNATEREARETTTKRTTREPELPGGSPPRSRRLGRREHGPKLRANHGLA